ncbi:PaaI family thioesterase [Adlercreutzia sp. R21]|uniref:PaaI family thioesterase n=1 Tax=Adlercreutzia wanghongyangiae TaxID=3111451 RepID=A0ABU6IHX0_9ACTN|nr:PaaI family thioesterase [Adlercreutzia sp. R21]MEC4176027.1 PaaI family thioesterase [Adlercreutzia sp. R7]MEC4183734.1 PaaI family thioesterase [Adlercreutzia sp. R21]
MAKQLSDHPTLDELNDFFGHDRFAEHVGCRIVEGAVGHGVVELDIQDHHRNALGNVMGGAVFTLADFALALASNIGQPPSVSVNSAIDFMSASRGTKLIATCDAEKSGRHLGFYTTEVTDDTGRRIARVTATVYREGE